MPFRKKQRAVLTACLQKEVSAHRQPKTDALTPENLSCVPWLQSPNFEDNSDYEVSSDTQCVRDSDSGSEYDGVSTLEEDAHPISQVGVEFRQKIQRHKKQGPSKANHAPTTIIMIERARAYFDEYVPCRLTKVEPRSQLVARFCSEVKANPEKALRKCKVEFIKGYLEWRVVFSRIKKESAIQSYWKVHSMLYADFTSRKMSDGILYDIRNVSY